MNRYICILAASLFSAANTYAESVNAEKARALALKYIASPVSVTTTPLRARAANHQRDKVTDPALHLFNNQQGEGFVIVAVDDRVGGVLGYSEKGTLDFDNMPSPLRSLLDAYASAVEAVRIDSTSVTPRYANPPKAFVRPLVSAKWSQEYPFNYYAPKSSSGRPTYTGCTITAAAQLLSAHRWPRLRPKGVPIGDGAMAYDYYDWDNMLDDYSQGGYSQAQAQAVGTLMRDLGKLALATYGVNGTICDEGKLWNALQNYYDCNVRQLEKDLLPGGEFLQAIYNELSLGCPVFMTGGDHAFIYDGYDENGLVHVNWGWGGLDDGYFDINTASVSSGGYGSDGCYYEKQLALFVHPNNGIIEPLAPKPVVLSINNNEGLQFSVNEDLTTSSKIPAQLKGVGARNLAQDENGSYTGQVGIGLFSQDGTCLHVFAVTDALTWSTYYTSYNYEYDWWAADLSEIDGPADGTYFLRPLGRRLLDAQKGEWGNWTYMINGNSVPMIVSDGKVTLVQADGKPHLSVVGMPEVVAPAYEYSSQLAGIQLNISNLSRYQARGELLVELIGTGNLEGEKYTLPNAYLSHMVAQRMDTTQWILKFMTSYSGTNGSQALKAGKYRLSLKFNHNIETKNPGIYEIPIPEDFLLEVLPSNYEGRVTVTSVKLLDEKGATTTSNHFNLSQSPTVTLALSGFSSNIMQNQYSTQIRYRLVNVATGATVYTSNSYKVAFPRNSETNLAASTSHTVDLTALAEGTYEVHVDVERDGAWLDRWNANTFRRKLTLYKAPTPTYLQITPIPAGQLADVASIAAFSAPFDAVVPNGATAWYTTQADDNHIQLTALPSGTAIPAGHGVLLTSAVTIDHFLLQQAPSSMPVADLTGNLLRASTDADHTITSSDNAYVLANEQGQTVFLQASVGSKLPRYAAYLQHVASATSLELNMSDKTTTINTAKTSIPSQRTDTYGLDGRRVSPNSASGIYIINGNKRIISGK